MDNRTTTLVVVLAVATVGAGVVAAVQWAERADLERRIAEPDARPRDQQQQPGRLRQELETGRNPGEETPICVDSDARHGFDSIYVRGTVRVGNTTVTDHCRLDRLVEFTCIENPPGSGRFLSEAKILSCPRGSRCVQGECLRRGDGGTGPAPRP
jgi:hypothetical protein